MLQFFREPRLDVIIRTIDAHAAGGPVRLIVDGFPAPRGRTMSDRREWANRHADQLRRVALLEPRGHADLCGAVLTEPVAPGSHAGVLFMDNRGYAALSGHGIIAVTTIALERGLLVPGGDGRTIVFDTPAGTVRATATQAGGGKVERVAFVNVPSFVVQGGADAALGTRRIRVDIAFGGAFYAIVDSEAVGVPADAAHLTELRRAAAEIQRAIESRITVVHPLDPRLAGLHGTIFTGPPGGAADLRNVTVFADGAVARSPGGTVTAAVMAVIDAMGLLDPGQSFVHEGLLGTTLTGRVKGRAPVGDLEGIVVEIEGPAWITGEHTLAVDAGDPFPEGVRL